MSNEVNIEQQVRLALGDLTLQLLAARAEIASLKEQVAKLEALEVPAKTNSKGKPNEPASGPQPN